MAYEAIVTRISVRPHPNADRLQLGTCHGFQVVVGLDTQDGELGVFFPTDGQLSEEFVLANDLYSESARLKLGLENKPGQRFGFFSDKRRVRAQSFRGQKSDGFWVPLSYFDHWCTVMGFPFKEGDTFTGVRDVEICRKYETPATLRAKGQKVGRKQRENKCFPKHDVTKQFRFVSGAIPNDAVIYITEKLHGTSGRYGYVLDDIELPWWKRFINLVFQAEAYPTRAYRYLNGSKNVILEKSTGQGYYGTNEFRYKAIEGLELRKGEVLYFEIVGYYSGAGLIMPAHPIKDEVKSLRKQYGDLMSYRYGTVPGQSAIYVYRILRTNEDGVAVELSYPQMVQRCAELGLKTVPLLFGPSVGYHGDGLQELVDEYTDGPSTLDSSHIREGVVLRVEAKDGTSYIKNKSFHFCVLEGIIKSDDSYVDMEESS